MKTVEIIQSSFEFQATVGDIHRMPDEAAEEIVRAGVGKYVPKTTWKKERDEKD